jgi:hypothetical protein
VQGLAVEARGEVALSHRSYADGDKGWENRSVWVLFYTTHARRSRESIVGSSAILPSPNRIHTMSPPATVIFVCFGTEVRQAYDKALRVLTTAQ